ncbi:MAG: hypothetical protein L0215_04095 [Gemmataceae bacterium]|nr:hypothetical protein [Gemmataceae bacterium]
MSFVSGLRRAAYFPSVIVVETEQGSVDEGQGILGRDVLKSCIFQYHGPEEQFTLAF